MIKRALDTHILPRVINDPARILPNCLGLFPQSSSALLTLPPVFIDINAVLKYQYPSYAVLRSFLYRRMWSASRNKSVLDFSRSSNRTWLRALSFLGSGSSGDFAAKQGSDNRWCDHGQLFLRALSERHDIFLHNQGSSDNWSVQIHGLLLDGEQLGSLV